MRTKLSRLALLAAFGGVTVVVAAACGSTTDVQASGAASSSAGGATTTTNATTSMDVGGSSTVGTGGSGGSVPLTCAWAKNSSSDAVCTSGACPISVDETLRCSDLEFAAPGLRVTPTPTATWLATTSSNDVEVYSIANGVETREAVPHDFFRAMLALGVGPSGDVHLAADPDSSNEALQDFKGTLYSTPVNGVWSEEQLSPDPTNYAPSGDIEVGSDGTTHVFLVTYDANGPAGFVDATPNGGSWSYAPIDLPSGGVPGDYNRFTLASDGAPVIFDLEYPTDELVARVDGVDHQVGTLESTQIPDYAVTGSMQPSSAAASGLFDVVYPHIDALQLVRVVASGTNIEETLANTNEPVSNCTPPSDLSMCSGTCEADYGGVPVSAYAVTRTDDGVAWIVYADTQFSGKLIWAPTDLGEGMMVCQGVGPIAAVSTLHLLRAPLDGVTTATEVMTLPLDTLGVDDVFGDFNADARFIDVRGFGKDLAIGVRTGTIDDGHAVRVLRLDTTTLM